MSSLFLGLLGPRGGPEMIMIFVVIILPILLAVWLNKRLHVKQPNARPFIWGYWLGFGCFLAPLFAMAQNDGSISFSLIAALLYVTIGVFVISRHRWALIAITIFSFNPIIWIANIFYIRNRWSEMKTPTQFQPHPPSIEDKNFPIKLDGVALDTQERQLAQSVIVPPITDLDARFEGQLRSLAQLRDDGIITEEEFNEKKRTILGL
jgi:hypothetical protein